MIWCDCGGGDDGGELSKLMIIWGKYVQLIKVVHGDNKMRLIQTMITEITEIVAKMEDVSEEDDDNHNILMI